MFVGTFICLASLYYSWSDPSCEVRHENIMAGGIMYLSYLCLFCQLLGRRIAGMRSEGMGEGKGKGKNKVA